MAQFVAFLAFSNEVPIDIGALMRLGLETARVSHNGVSTMLSFCLIICGGLLSPQPVQSQLLFSHKDDVYDVHMQSPGKLYSISRDKTIRYWDLKAGRSRTLIETRFTPYTMTFSPDKRLLAASGFHDHIEIWRLTDLSKVQKINLPGVSVGVLQFAKSGKHDVIGAGMWDGTIAIVSMLDSKVAIKKKAHNDIIHTLVFILNGACIITASQDGIVTKWKAAGLELIDRVNTEQSGLWSLIVSSDEKYFVSGGKDKTIKVWNLSTNALVRTVRGHDSPVSGLAFSNDGKQLFSCGRRGDIKVWEFPRMSGAKTLANSRKKMLSIRAFPRWDSLVAFGDDGYIEVFTIRGANK